MWLQEFHPQHLRLGEPAAAAEAQGGQTWTLTRQDSDSELGENTDTEEPEFIWRDAALTSEVVGDIADTS